MIQNMIVMKKKNYFALYAFDQRPESASHESYGMRIAVAFVLVLFSALTLIAIR